MTVLKYYIKPLMSAALSNDMTVIGEILKSIAVAAMINERDSFGMTALMHASAQGNTKAVKMLIIDERTDLTAVDENGYTAERIASMLDDDTEILDLLRNASKYRFMHAVAIGNIQSVLRYITENKDDPDSINQITNPETGLSPLVTALLSGHKEIALALLRAGNVDFGAKYYGMNLLMLAAKSGCDNCINIFCNSSQIDINEKYENKTALLMAVDAHHIEFANIVVGCNPNIYINKNLAHIEKMLNLLGHGSAYEYINNALNQYIRSAILEGKVDVINEYIRVFGHDESYFVREIRLRKYDEDEHPISLLFFAVWHGQTACAIALANVKKIDLNAKFEGETSLIVATRQGHIEIVKDLLSRDETDVNERDFFGWTAFIHVAKQNNLEMTRLFLKDGRVHLTQRTYKGRDAFFYAHRHASCRNTEPVLDDAAHLIMEACL